MIGKSGKVVNRYGCWCVVIYDHGWVYMTELTEDGFVTCTFDTEEEAQKALDEYLECWK